jgi:hypothetical protein
MESRKRSSCPRGSRIASVNSYIETSAGPGIAGFILGSGGTLNTGSLLGVYDSTSGFYGVTLASNVTGGPLRFSASGGEKARITASGWLGLGTKTPDSPWQVSFASPAQGILGHLTTSDSQTTGAYLQITQTGRADWALGVHGGDTSFAINYGKTVSAAGTDVMTLTSAGAVTFAGAATATQFNGSGAGLNSGTVPTAALVTNAQVADINFVIDVGGSAVTTGIKGDLRIDHRSA